MENKENKRVLAFWKMIELPGGWHSQMWKRENKMYLHS